MTKEDKNLPPISPEAWAVLQAYDHFVGIWFQALEYLANVKRYLESDHPEVLEQQEKVVALDEVLSEMVKIDPWLAPPEDDSPSNRHDDEVRDITLFGIGE